MGDDYNMDTGETILLKQQEVVGGYDSEAYYSERLYANARDGKPIPISLVYKKDQRLDRPQNLLLYAYGSYGLSIDPYFSSNLLSLLDNSSEYISGAAFLIGLILSDPC